MTGESQIMMWRHLISISTYPEYPVTERSVGAQRRCAHLSGVILRTV